VSGLILAGFRDPIPGSPFMKRVLLFIATNIAVLVVLSIVLNLLGVGSILEELTWSPWR